MLNGACLCGAVTFTVTGAPGEATACHCSQCRRQSGHYWASVEVPDDDLRVEGAVTWFAATPLARRGICGTCGSFLFWKGNGLDRTAVSLGAMDAPTGLRLIRHIFVADKGDYYDIGDGLPQSADGSAVAETDWKGNENDADHPS